jgi:hypothetical protein
MSEKRGQRISEIFKSVGQPTVTYVHRKDEKFEETLKSGILNSGQLCLITGPSKTGKTTLYKKVLEELGRQPLIVRCDTSLSPNEFWARALESIDFTRLKELQETSKLKTDATAKAGRKVGWGWLASLIGEASLAISRETGETEIRERILARPSPLHLIPLLKKLPISLVVEDYHYLTEETKKIVFQQWKSFVDEEVSVIVIGTTHHAIDIISANKDLLARVSHIEISRWSLEDLKSIVQKGFDHLKIQARPSVKQLIANESVGLPILTQQCCEQLFIDKGITIYEGQQEIDFTPSETNHALLDVAKAKYGQLENYYNRLVVGPRKRARKYDTYEPILSCFAQEPIKFSLRRYEIDDRLSKINLGPKKRPPAPSIASTLNALGRFQSRAGLELLEWQPAESVLYILEPSFLFYLRCRGINEIAERGRKIGLSFSTKALEALEPLRRISQLNLFDSVQVALFRQSTMLQELDEKIREALSSMQVKIEQGQVARGLSRNKPEKK